MDRQADLTPWVALAECAGLPDHAVGRKARVLAQAGAHGLRTPGGHVLPSAVYWRMLERCGVAARVRYLAEAALRLDPDHVLGIAAGIGDALAIDTLREIAAPLARALVATTRGARLVCRSSAAMEDGRDAAFPGMFLSILDIASPDALADAIVACWRSVFAPPLLHYLLRMRPAAIDFSLALLVQPQVEAAWYGVCFSEDPLAPGGGMIAQLSDAAPDALVDGAPARLRFAWSDGGWRGDGAVPAGLDALAAAAALLHARAGAPVDIEFALPRAAAEPVILQCRPLTRPRAPPGEVSSAQVLSLIAGTPCAPGRIVGRARAGDVALVARLTTQDYPLVLASRAVVCAAQTSPLSHVAILCRELGVPLVAGVDGAALGARWLLVDGNAGTVARLADDAVPAVDAATTPDEADAVLGTTELLLRMRARARPGDDPDVLLRETLAAYRRGLGGAEVRLVPGRDLPAACGRAPAIDAAVASALAHSAARPL